MIEAVVPPAVQQVERWSETALGRKDEKTVAQESQLCALLHSGAQLHCGRFGK